MGFVVHLHQLADSGVGVPLGGGKRAVAEQLLDGAQVGTVGEQMGGKGVAQRMRVKVPVDVHQAHVLFDDASDRARGQAAAGVVQENPLWIGSRACLCARSICSLRSMSARFSPVSSLTRKPEA